MKKQKLQQLIAEYKRRKPSLFSHYSRGARDVIKLLNNTPEEQRNIDNVILENLVKERGERIKHTPDSYEYRPNRKTNWLYKEIAIAICEETANYDLMSHVDQEGYLPKTHAKRIAAKANLEFINDESFVNHEPLSEIDDDDLFISEGPYFFSVDELIEYLDFHKVLDNTYTKKPFSDNDLRLLLGFKKFYDVYSNLDTQAIAKELVSDDTVKAIIALAKGCLHPDNRGAFHGEFAQEQIAVGVFNEYLGKIEPKERQALMNFVIYRTDLQENGQQHKRTFRYVYEHIDAGCIHGVAFWFAKCAYDLNKDLLRNFNDVMFPELKRKWDEAENKDEQHIESEYSKSHIGLWN